MNLLMIVLCALIYAGAGMIAMSLALEPGSLLQLLGAGLVVTSTAVALLMIYKG